MTVFNSIGVLGAGTMGSGIAAHIALQGRRVVLVDTKPEFIDRALENIRQRIDARNPALRRQYPESTDEIMERIHGTCDSGPLKHLPFVVECIPEDIESKHDTLKYLSDLCRDTTVFGTSVTSTTVAALTEGLACAERTVGFHFFSPNKALPLVELIVPEAAKSRAVRTAEHIARAMGAVPIHVADTPGFAVNRMQAALIAESIRMINEPGIDIATVEAAATAALGISGPFSVMNAEGLPAAEAESRGLVGHLPDLYLPPERLRAQSQSGELWVLDGDPNVERQRALQDRFTGLALLVGAALVDEEVCTADEVNWAFRYGLGCTEGPFENFNRIGGAEATELAAALAELRSTAVPAVLKNFSSKTGQWPTSYVDVDIDEATAWITIRRPDTGNALDDTLVSQLDAAVKKVEKNDSVQTVVFSGTGGALVSAPSRAFFVDKLEAGKPEGILALYRRIHELFSKISNSKKITVARPHGLTEGPGFELALACRYLVAAPRAFFAFPETGLGIHPALGGTQRLPRKVGKSIGKYVIMTGELLTAEAAERLGIADTVLDDEDALPLLFSSVSEAQSISDEEIGPSEEELAAISLFNGIQCGRTLKGDLPEKSGETARRVADALAAKAPVALTLVNKLIDDGLGLALPKALHFELSAFGLILGTKDALVGLKADDRTPPSFTGE